MFSKATALLALTASASAHIIMTNPVPFGQATIDQAPLAPADFPCKQRPGVYDVTQMNQWKSGESLGVKLIGGATHSGGSCQFSITTDPEPTKDSQWKVIHSVIGGCVNDFDGNLSGDAKDERNPAIPVTMPKDVPDGRYTFAWTWLNKSGNREFYMNCAPIMVSGSTAGKASTTSVKKALSSLPDMFVVNLPEEQCKTTAMADFVYPNPGQSVTKGGAGTTTTSLEGPGCATQTKMGAGAGQLGSPTSGDSPSSPGGGVFAPGASSAPASSPAAQPNPPASQPSVPAAQPSAPMANPVPTQPETPKSPENNNNSNTPTSGGCTPCTTDGAVVCIGSKQFGLCNRGCAVAQDLAAGMVCKNGAIVGAAKRHLHFPRAHLHRRLSAARLL